MNAGNFLRICVAVVMRPALWITATRQGLRLARRGWWKTPPFLPLPSPAYLEFRITTQYGAANATLEIADVIDYLKWCRDWDSTGGPANGRTV